MIGLFKPKRLGKVYSYSNQFIETDFFLFLFPTQSYFINQNTKQSIKIPLNKTSLKNYYVSFCLVFSGILSFLVMISFGPSFSANEINMFLAYTPAIIAGSLIAAGLIYSFRAGKSNKYEIKKRTIFQSVVEINAMPQWFSVETAKNIYEKYKGKLPQNLKEKITNNQYSTDDFFYYYTMLSYQNIILPTNENTELLNQLDKKLKK